MRESSVPRLLYVGDVPIESSYHGSALLFRLLSDYPPASLRVIETSMDPSKPERRLPGVAYSTIRVRGARLQRTRFHRLYALWLWLSSGFRLYALSRLLDGFVPDAVLTVAHGYSWLSAAKFAKKRQLPVHLIVHDDWPRFISVPAALRRKAEKEFSRRYHDASSRLCVSTYMASEYFRRYGVAGQVLYPSRGPDCPEHTEPSPRVRSHMEGGPVYAFAGTLNMPNCCRLLVNLADCLDRLGGRLLIFGPLEASHATGAGLQRRNIRLCGLLSSAELVRYLRENADVLFLPMSFDEVDRPNMTINFPSKLTDYTAVGVPILIVGPPYSSAVRWARENTGVAEVLDTDDPEQLADIISILSANADRRYSLASTALVVGRSLFSHAAALAALTRILRLNPDRAS